MTLAGGLYGAMTNCASGAVDAIVRANLTTSSTICKSTQAQSGKGSD